MIDRELERRVPDCLVVFELILPAGFMRMVLAILVIIFLMLIPFIVNQKNVSIFHE